jgi:hypothetical protein
MRTPTRSASHSLLSEHAKSVVTAMRGGQTVVKIAGMNVERNVETIDETIDVLNVEMTDGPSDEMTEMIVANVTSEIAVVAKTVTATTHEDLPVPVQVAHQANR